MLAKVHDGGMRNKIFDVGSTANENAAIEWLCFIRMPGSSFLTSTTGGVRIAVHAQPRASRSEIAGTHGDALKIRLAAPPVDGAANEALIELLSKQLRVPKSAIRIVQGMTGRRKVVEIEGVSVTDCLTHLHPRT